MKKEPGHNENLEVKVAENSGFCKGVALAYKTALAQKSGTKVLGELVHNTDVQEELAESGIFQVNSTEELADGDSVIIRAHGETVETLAELRRREMKIIDCTCRNVRRIQQLAQRCHAEDYKVAIFGKMGHPEFKSISSFAGKDSLDITNVETVQSLTEQFNRLVLLAQTTSSPEKYEEVKRLLEERTQQFKAPNTLCGFTQKARTSAVELAKKVDMMLVIGGKNSSNTRNLTLACIETRTRTHSVERAADLDQIQFNNIHTIGVTAGASTPPRIIEEVVRNLK